MPGKRYTRGEAHDAVLAAGLELLVECGSSIGLDRISFARAIERSGVPRPSAYRAFGDSPIDPQDHFRDELALRIIEHCASANLSRVEAAVADIAAEALREDITSDELTTLLRELVRVAATEYPCQMGDDPYLQPYVTLLAAARNENNCLTGALQKAHAESGEESVTFYRGLSDVFGLRLREGWTWQTFAAAISSLEYGDYLTQAAVPDIGIERPTGPGGAPQIWTRLAAMIEGLIIAAFEPNPRMRVAAIPANWNT